MVDDGTGNPYIHGTGAGERARLVTLNRLTNPAFVEFLHIEPGMRVLEVGSGLGFLAADVAAAAEDVGVIGVERSAEQLAVATRSARVDYVRGDAHCLSFADGSFDLVYCRYVLEHVAGPERVLAEMRRVARPGGRVVACENDIGILQLDPSCPAFEAVWLAFRHYQARLGGDGLIGRRLYRLFRAAGFTRIELTVQPEVHWAGTDGLSGCLQILSSMIESARRGMVESSLCTEAQIADAIAELAALVRSPDASWHFLWNRAVAIR